MSSLTSVDSLLSLASAGGIKTARPSRSSWVRFVPVFDKLDAMRPGMEATAKIDWIIEQGGIAPADRIKAYGAITGIIRRRSGVK